MAFFFAYTQVRTADQNIAFTCCIGFCLNIYYGTLYAYTPEVLPSAHRGTGNGIAIGLNRIMGIISAVIATVANTSSSPSVPPKTMLLSTNIKTNYAESSNLLTGVIRKLKKIFSWSWSTCSALDQAPALPSG